MSPTSLQAPCIASPCPRTRSRRTRCWTRIRRRRPPRPRRHSVSTPPRRVRHSSAASIRRPGRTAPPRPAIPAWATACTPSRSAPPTPRKHRPHSCGVHLEGRHHSAGHGAGHASGGGNLRDHGVVRVPRHRGGFDIPVPPRWGGVGRLHLPGRLQRPGNGVHTFAVRATDPAGNTDPAPAEFTWSINTAVQFGVWPSANLQVAPTPSGTGLTRHLGYPSNNQHVRARLHRRRIVSPALLSPPSGQLHHRKP